MFDERNQFYLNHNTNYDAEGNKIKNIVIWVFDMKDRKNKMFINAGKEIPYNQCDNLDFQNYLSYERIGFRNRNSPVLLADKGEYRNCHTQGACDYSFLSPVTIEWNTPKKMFSSSGSLTERRNNNIIVLLDVTQVRALSYQKYNMRLDEWNEKWITLGKEYNKYQGLLADMHSFFVCCNKTSISTYTSINDHPIEGVCVPYETFLDINSIDSIVPQLQCYGNKPITDAKDRHRYELRIRGNEDDYHKVMTILTRQSGNTPVRWYMPNGKSGLLSIKVPYDNLLLIKLQDKLGDENVKYSKV